MCGCTRWGWSWAARSVPLALPKNAGEHACGEPCSKSCATRLRFWEGWAPSTSGSPMAPRTWTSGARRRRSASASHWRPPTRTWLLCLTTLISAAARGAAAEGLVRLARTEYVRPLWGRRTITIPVLCLSAALGLQRYWECVLRKLRSVDH